MVWVSSLASSGGSGEAFVFSKKTSKSFSIIGEINQDQ
jgi:hypothetical protein